MEKKAMVGAVMAIIAVILIGVTFALPWYTMTMKGNVSGMGTTTEQDYYLDHATAKVGNTTMSESYSNKSMQDSIPNTVNTFKTTQILDIVSLVFVIIGFIGALLFAIGKLGKGVAVALVVIGFILSIIAPIYLMTALPPAIKKDSKGSLPVKEMGESFFGEKKISMFGATVTVTWGGGLGWWLAIIGMIFMLIALILVLLAKKAQASIPQMPSPPQTTQEISEESRFEEMQEQNQ